MSNALFIGPATLLPAEMTPAAGGRLEQKIAAAKNASGEDKDAAIRKAAQEFEAIFIAQMLKVMRSAIEESGLTDGGFGKTMYTELFDQELALNMARHGAIGIADLLYRNLTTMGIADEGEWSPNQISRFVPEYRPYHEVIPGNSRELRIHGSSLEGLNLPVEARISSLFGYRQDPFSRQQRFHKGVDFAAPAGTKVVSALPGAVIFAGYDGDYGNTVVIEHRDGVKTRYAHLDNITVKTGDVIEGRSALGVVGDTGRSTGPHLHFEILIQGRPVDPVAAYRSALAERNGQSM
ncbi:MAG TPA: peptidoglycan DD-metalloendopeptidase family protein [Acidobacteriota bacterium]|nr:peptidoglycan DD-metalloendopeptidase family protein [Acidobacteriota bacterium]